jgi:hypothetical protein
MNEISLLQTALLLGLYVALAGSYGLVYAIARLNEGSILHRISFIVYGLHGLDDPPHWNHGGHHGGVVDSVSPR